MNTEKIVDEVYSAVPKGNNKNNKQLEAYVLEDGSVNIYEEDREIDTFANKKEAKNKYMIY